MFHLVLIIQPFGLSLNGSVEVIPFYFFDGWFSGKIFLPDVPIFSNTLEALTRSHDEGGRQIVWISC